MVAILILAVPVSYAALTTPDTFSANFLKNKGAYSNVVDAAGAAQHSLKNKASQSAPDSAAAKPAAVAKAPTQTQPPSSATAAGAPPAAATASAPPAATTQTPAGSTPPGASGTAPAPAAGAGQAAQAQSFGSFSLADLEAQVPKSKEGNFILEVPELYYTAGDLEVQKVLTGQKVETVAQVLPEKVNNPDGHRIRVFRLQIQCCAADARPYSIPVDFGKKAPEFKDMTWVKVVGKMNYKQESGQTVPILEAIGITETTAPDSAMVY